MTDTQTEEKTDSVISIEEFIKKIDELQIPEIGETYSAGYIQAKNDILKLIK